LQRRGDERQRGLGNTGARRQPLGELLQTIVSQQLANEAEENWALFDLPDQEL
jgi:hypothetical protein